MEKKEVPFEELEPTLKSFIEKAPDLTVVLRLDQGLMVQDMVNVLQMSKPQG